MRCGKEIDKMEESLRKYTRENISFHMPGHKSGKLKLIDDFYGIDVTEVEGTDNLYHPSGILLEAEAEIADIYGSKASFLLVNGSTGGILASISAALKNLNSKTLIMGRNCHKAVYHAAYLERLEPIYAMPEYHEDYGFYMQTEAMEIQKLLEKQKEAAVVVITSPTYEGIVSDIERIAQLVHGQGGILIVDEAHGAHFSFSRRLPKSAVEQGADLVIHSTHKTLPALTQTGILHLASQRIKPEEVRRQLSIFQTSSPSYIFMTSILKSVRYMNEQRKAYTEQLEKLDQMMTVRMAGSAWLHQKCFSKEEDQRKQDLSRLVFLVDATPEKEENYKVSGYDLNRRLREKYHIQVEMSGLRHIVAISTIADSEEDILALIRGINALMGEQSPQLRERIDREKSYVSFQLVKEHPKERNLYEAEHSVGEEVFLCDALGKVSKQFIIPYPPGIPLLVPGEVVTEEKISLLLELVHEKCEIYGIIEGERIEIISRRLS